MPAIIILSLPKLSPLAEQASALGRPCQPGHVMEGAAHDYSVASHNGLTASRLCPGGCVVLAKSAVPFLQLQSVNSLNGSAFHPRRVIFMLVFLSKYAHLLLQSLLKRYVSNSTW